MNRAVLFASIAVIGLSSGAVGAADAEKSVTEKIVDTLTALAGGPHPGYRANHAKGVVATASFVPAPSAKSLTKASFLEGSAKVPAIVRFSNGTGVPNLPDAHAFASPHGMAIRFQLPDGGMTDIVVISHNGFPVATPEDLLGLFQAIATTRPDSPKPTPIEQFLGSHPAALKFVTAPKPAPVSYATLPFYGVNAFKFTNAKGESQYGRYQIVPVAGDQRLSDADAAKASPNYLRDELVARLKTGPAQFRLLVQVAKPGDSVDDATQVWPDDRALVELGTLSIESLVPNNDEAQKALAFNPLILVDGIEPSLDPVLLARPGAYAVSVGRRNQ